MTTRNMKWISIPVLLMGSMFSQLAGNYELPIDLLACVGAALLAVQAIRKAEYFWAGTLGLVVIAFSPVPLVSKLFLLLSYAAIASLVTVVAAFRLADPRPVQAKAETSLSIIGDALTRIPQRTA